MRWLKHAFAVDPPGPAEPTEAQRLVVEKVCRQIIRRRLTSPALLFLEVARPLNYVGAQAMYVFHPIVSAVVDASGYAQFAAFLEQRGSIEYMCRRIESIEQEQIEAKRARRRDASVDAGEPDPPDDG